MPARRIPLSHSAHVTGWHPVCRGHGMVAFESSLERDCITWLASLPGFRSIEGQPISVFVEIVGVRRRYTPDFRVMFDTLPEALIALGFEEETFVEVKYAEQAARDRALIAARLAAVTYATGWPAVLLDETVIRARTIGTSA
jgi:hypothetical protein